GGGKEVSLPLANVAMFWRAPVEGTVLASRLRRELLAGPRPRDTGLLRNGDTLTGLPEKLDGKLGEGGGGKKRATARVAQEAAVVLSSELAEAPRVAGLHARVVVRPDVRSPGGRFTLADARCRDGKVLEGQTAFGAAVSVPLARVLALEVLGGKAVDLDGLKPAGFEYAPYLDERRTW